MSVPAPQLSLSRLISPEYTIYIRHCPEQAENPNNKCLKSFFGWYKLFLQILFNAKRKEIKTSAGQKEKKKWRQEAAAAEAECSRSKVRGGKRELEGGCIYRGKTLK